MRLKLKKTYFIVILFLFLAGMSVMITRTARGGEIEKEDCHVSPVVKDTTEIKGYPSAEFSWDFNAQDRQNEALKVRYEAPVKFTALSVGWSQESSSFEPEDFKIRVKTKPEEDSFSGGSNLNVEYTPQGIPSEKYWSDLYLTSGGKKHGVFQIEFIPPDAAAVDTLKVSVADTSASERTEMPGASMVSDADEDAPNIITREQWWGDLPEDEIDSPDWEPDSIKVTHSIVHHTATPNNPPDPEQVVRSIWDYHARNLEWGDIGYNFLIDQHGNIYQGRHNPWLDTQDTRAGHAYGANSDSFGVSLIGQFQPGATPSAVDPEEEAVNSLEKLIAWRFKQYELNPLESEYIAGTLTERIGGHRDVGATACPGDNLYELLPEIRDNVKEIISSAEEFELTVEIEGEGEVDPPEGQYIYDEGEEVALTTTPGEGWEFVRWEGEVEDPYKKETFIIMDGDREVTAVFESLQLVEIKEFIQERYDSTITLDLEESTLDEGEVTEPVKQIVLEGEKAIFAANWESGKIKLTVFNPQGDIYEKYSSSDPPIAIEVDDAKAGEWSYTLEAVDLPHSDYPCITLVEAREDLSGGIDDIAVNVEGEIILVALEEYAYAYGLRDTDAMYAYLCGDTEGPEVAGLRSGNKFISLQDYAYEYGLADTTQEALENAPALSRKETGDYKKLVDFNKDSEEPVLKTLY